MGVLLGKYCVQAENMALFTSTKKSQKCKGVNLPSLDEYYDGIRGWFLYSMCKDNGTVMNF